MHVVNVITITTIWEMLRYLTDQIICLHTVDNESGSEVIDQVKHIETALAIRNDGLDCE